MATLAKLLVELDFDGEDFNSGAQQAARTWDQVGKKMLAVGAGLTAFVTLPMVKAGKVAWDAAIAYDGALDTIQTKTGATGDELNEFGELARQVYRSIPTDIQTAADTVATLSQKTDQVGDGLRELAQVEIELARITGGDLATQVSSTAEMFNKWGIETTEQVASLDKLFAASQETGTSVQTLADNLTKYAQPLSELGFSFDEAVAVLARFEEAGVNVDQAMAGLKLGLVNLAKEGITDADTAFRTMVDRVKAAPTDIEATKIAVELFGAKAGPELAKAIRDGTLEVDDLVAAMNDGRPGILETAAATNDFAEKLQIMKNRVTDALMPLGTQLFNAVNNLMPLFESAATKLTGLVERFNELPAPVRNAAGVVLLLLAGLGPLLTILGTVITLAPAIGAAVTIMFGPWGIAVMGVIAAIAGLYYAYQTNFLGFRDGVQAALQWVRTAFDDVKPAIDRFVVSIMGVVDTLLLFQPEVQKAGELLRAAFEAALPIITVMLETAAQLVTNFVTTVINVFSGLLRSVKGILQVLKGIFTGDFGLIKEGVTNIVGGLKDAVVALIKGLLNQIKIQLTATKVVMVLIWQTVKDEVVSIVTGLVDSAVSLITGMTDLLFNAAFNAGYGVGQGIINGISAIWDSVTSYVGSLVDAVVDKLSDVPGFSPIEHVGQYYGRQLGVGFAEGIGSATGVSETAASGLVRAATTGMTTNLYGGLTLNVNGAGDPRATADAVWDTFARELSLREGG